MCNLAIKKCEDELKCIFTNYSNYYDLESKLDKLMNKYGSKTYESATKLFLDNYKDESLEQEKPRPKLYIVK